MLLAAPALLSLAVLARGAGMGEDAPERAAVRAVLRPAPDDRRSSTQVLGELVRLGPGPIPIYFGIASGTGLGELFSEPELERIHELSLATPEELVRLAQRALVRQPSASLLPFLEAELQRPAEADAHLTILWVLGARASAEGLELYWKVLESLDELVLRHPRMRAGARDALAEILRADAVAWERLERRCEGSTNAERELVAESIAHAGRPQGARVLLRLLAGAPGPAVRGRYLAALAELEHLAPWELEGETLRAMRSSWHSLAAEPSGDLALALAHTDDPQAAELLLELGEGGARPRRLAGAALTNLARTSLPADASAWRDWHEHELAWRDERWGELALELVGQDPAACVRALHELLAHPLFRRDAARLVAECLADAPAQAAPEACRSLSLLGSRAALPGLVSALDSASDEVRLHAARTLRALTGEDRPAEADAWRAGLLD